MIDPEKDPDRTPDDIVTSIFSTARPMENVIVRRMESRTDLGAEDDSKHPRDHIMTCEMISSSIVTSRLASVTISSPTPVPGLASAPPLEQGKSPDSDFVPPARPSSTPFPYPEDRISQVCDCDDLEIGWTTESLEATSARSYSIGSSQTQVQAAYFEELPVEVHESILDYLFGYREPVVSTGLSHLTSSTKSLGTAFRHSRRKELTELALVSPTWRYLVQERLYRHIKLRASVTCISDALVHFSENRHLKEYVKHLEMWFPVFQPAYGSLATSNTLTLPTVTSEGLTNATYTLPSNNCSLDEVFSFVSLALPRAVILTIEGGERRKAPQVAILRKPSWWPDMPKVTSVQTLVTRGQWNLMRDYSDFEKVMGALPNLVEWYGSYSKPKSKAYISVSNYLPRLPRTLSSLSLCLECDYKNESSTPGMYYKACQQCHICASMALTLLTLESFSYTGRVCHQLLDIASRMARDDSRTMRLKSLDLTVKNCCRYGVNLSDAGSGIHNLGFIDAFERLVLSGVRALEKFPALEYLRIRFIDLEAKDPRLNPYFLLRRGRCTGVWSDKIVSEMARVRPSVTFLDLSDMVDTVIFPTDGPGPFRPEKTPGRLTSWKFSIYRQLAARNAQGPPSFQI